MQRDQPCYAFIYTPNNSAVVDELIKSVRLSNSPPVPQDQVMAMSSPDEVRNSKDRSTVMVEWSKYATAVLTGRSKACGVELPPHREKVVACGFAHDCRFAKHCCQVVWC